MSQAPSFDRINYLLRPNKHIERRLVFDRLMRMRSQISFSNHRYLGLGSLWFVDFVLAHRTLQLIDMISIECEVDKAPRMEFNKPYATIEIRPGLSLQVLTEMTDEEWSRPNVVWLDYDGCVDDTVTEDLGLLLRRLAADSVLIISVNANRKFYRSPTDQSGVNRPALDKLKTLLGDESLPTGYPTVGAGEYADISNSDFPSFLGSALLNFMHRKFRLSGRQEGGDPLRFLPSFNFCHQDGADMVTVGGIIATPEKCDHIMEYSPDLAGSIDHAGNPSQTLLNLSQLTIREKITLDRLLPFQGEGFEQRAVNAGLSLPIDEYSKYRSHYLHFPVFTESFF